MECRQAAELMNAAILRDLNPAQQAAFDNHLAGCQECRAEYGVLGGAFNAPASVPEPPERWSNRAVAQPTQRRLETLENRIILAGRLELAGARVIRRKPRLILYAAAVAGFAAAAVFLVAINLPLAAPGAGTCACEDSWRFVDGDAANSRRQETASFGVPTQVLWEKKIPGAAGTYKPLAWKDLVIVNNMPGSLARKKGGGLMALDAKSGAVRWQKTFAAGDYFKAKGFPDRCLLQGRLYITDGQVCRVLNAATGEELAVFAAPSAADGWNYLGAAGERLYGTSRDGRTVFCVDRISGEAVWHRTAGGEVFIPALAQGRLYLQTSTGTVASLDAANGRQIWHCEQTGLRGKAGVYAAGQRILVLAENDQLAAFDAERGTCLWEQYIPGAYQAGMALGTEAAYILAGRAAVALTDGRLLWQHTEQAVSGLCTPPTVTGGRLLTAAGNKPGQLHLWTASGEPLGQLDEAASRACDGAIVAGGVIFTAGGGRFLAVDCR